ncbi:GDP-mannose 4,6-dehydratase [Sodalis glossinidius str. 'morsitans']|uniref:GDP-mannose 4,6-dehydratase n=1 Tax=Sodalis glossinidius (strain morsitans) TaxID=343509 RepID=A0A193QGG2_SODGM|nr:GDP-mannose 4,6-dehydratase [Sodalis glossinidius str. 'morsitans']
MAARELGIEIVFEGQGINEKAFVSKITGGLAPSLRVGDVIVEVDERYFRPTEVDTLLGDPSYAQQRLGWQPEISLQQLIAEMVEHDLQATRQHSLLKSHGYAVCHSVE